MAFGKFGKYYPGGVDLRPETFDLVANLRLTLERLGSHDGAGHNLKFSTNRDHCIVRSDPMHVSFVVMNLLLNALKYSSPGSPVELRVTAETGAIELYVADRGIGIPEEELNLLFSPFFRASNVGDRPGTGMGLAIVKKSAQLIGAQVRVAARAGGGTEFKVSLPADMPAAMYASGGGYG